MMQGLLRKQTVTTELKKKKKTAQPIWPLNMKQLLRSNRETIQSLENFYPLAESLSLLPTTEHHTD